MNQQTETFRAPTRRTGRFEGLFCLLDSPGDVLKHPRMTDFEAVKVADLICDFYYELT